jgi:hypothetical protein
MGSRTIVTLVTWPMLAFGLTLITPARVLAHCDGLNGPVVKAAQQALETRNPALTLGVSQISTCARARWLVLAAGWRMSSL